MKHPALERVTERIRERSQAGRAEYLARIRAAVRRGPRRRQLPCSNFAHGYAACPAGEKAELERGGSPNVAIVSAYNDMLSAHQPLESYPALIKSAVRAAGGVAQFAGGVPAMCDGITQGEPAMELSLLSRDVIAMATAVALAHEMFDAAVCLGVCDKIVPGLLIGALAFGHLPCVFIPAGPMPSGLSNAEKARIRQLHAEGKIGEDELLAAEAASYHSPGTCTFYGTANSNQMLMEVMGLHLPGASFVNPGTPLRAALTAAAARRAAELTALGEHFLPVGEMLDERSFANAIVGLLATGGSTNHTLHLVAMARAAGIVLDWDDFDALSAAVPLLARIYPNGSADVNHFAAAGGMAFLIGELSDAGLLHTEARTVMGDLGPYRHAVELGDDGEPRWGSTAVESRDLAILRPVAAPFQPTGGLRRLAGNLGRAVIKTSAVAPERWVVEAPAVVFETPEALLAAFQRGELERDLVAVVRFQGPRANGMPELHKLVPPLCVLQDRGFRVALVTDGRLSGASGKVPAAIHLSPEAASGGALARLRTGDVVRLDAVAGTLEAKVEAGEWGRREPAVVDLTPYRQGVGRELFGTLRAAALGAEEGAGTFGA